MSRYPHDRRPAVAATIAIIVIVTGGQVDRIQTNQVSRVWEFSMEGCR